MVKLECAWVVLIGDSNTRNVVTALLRLSSLAFLSERHQWPQAVELLLSLIRAGSAQGVLDPRCSDKWFDQEHLLVLPSKSKRCLHISFRFLRDGGEVARVLNSAGQIRPPRVCPDGFYMRNTNWTAASCAKHRVLASCSAPPSSEFTFPPQPNFVLLSHGLWSTPQSWNVTCASRFEQELRVLRALRSRSVAHAWQTPYPLDRHAWISNGVLREELACQRDSGFTLLDLWAPVESRKLQLHQLDGYHLNAASAEWLARRLWDLTGISERWLQRAPLVVSSTPLLAWQSPHPDPHPDPHASSLLPNLSAPTPAGVEASTKYMGHQPSHLPLPGSSPRAVSEAITASRYSAARTGLVVQGAAVTVAVMMSGAVALTSCRRRCAETTNTARC